MTQTAKTQTAKDMKPPAAPPPPAAGFAYKAVHDPAWQVADPGRGCRWRPAAPPGQAYPPACGKDAVTAAEDPNNPLYPWREYCAGHTLAHLHWIERGQVMTWELRHEDGSPVTGTEAELAQLIRRRRTRDWCSQHKRPRSDCPPDFRHAYSIRQRGDLMAVVERLAKERRMDVNAFVTQALEQAAGWTPPGPPRRLSAAGGQALHRDPAVPAADRTAPPRAENAATEKAGSTPGAVSRPPVAARGARAAAAVRAAREAGHDVRTASELAAVPVGAAMFQPPGGEKVITGLAPEVPDHSGKKGRAAPATAAAACPPHPRKRVIKNFCYACGRMVGDDERTK